MEITTYDHGIPSWVDIGTDLDKGKAFYSGLFGWDCPEGPPETGGYSNATLRGKTVAGLGPQQMPDVPPFWTTYINVDRADEIAEKVTAHGGSTMVPPMDVMEFGRMALFIDPVGAIFGVWQPGRHTGAEIVNEPGALTWNELITTDVDASKAFYGAVFGWGAEPSAGPMDYTEWKLGNRSIGGMMAKTADMPAELPPHWMVYFGVADIEAAVAKINELGGGVLTDVMDTPAGKMVPVMDDCGATFSVIQLSDNLGG